MTEIDYGLKLRNKLIDAIPAHAVKAALLLANNEFQRLLDILDPQSGRVPRCIADSTYYQAYGMIKFVDALSMSELETAAAMWSLLVKEAQEASL